jgi:hypothetical protein
MTEQTSTRQSLWREFSDVATKVAVPHHEPPDVIRRRRIVVVVVLVVGAALLGYSLSRPPGDSRFYWLTLALAAVWARCIWVACGSAVATNVR